MRAKVKLCFPDYKDLLQYGDVESDHTYGDCTRVMKIRYSGILYYLKMEDKKLVSLKQWDNFAYQDNEKDIHLLTDKELADMLMFADRDRKDNSDAERVYWLCVSEVNRRL